MFEKQDCNYTTYRGIIKNIVETGRYMDYAEALNADEFIVMRHDIEFSVDRAYNLAKIESECNFTSSYLVQITNNAYNALSKKNVDYLREMLNMGHKIGLHYHRNGISDIARIKEDIIFQAQVLSEFLGIGIDRFSFHRPEAEHLKVDISIDGMINCYGSYFFTYTEDASTVDKSKVKYIADSNHQWKYGLPNEEYFSEYPKIQILTHPLSWTEYGTNHLDCFKGIANEKSEEFIKTIQNEWKIFYMLEGKL